MTRQPNRRCLAAQEPGETQNDHSNEHDSGNDRHPRRCLIKPLRMCWRRSDGRRRNRRLRNRRWTCLAHASSSCLRSASAASGQPGVSAGNPSARPENSEPGAPLRGRRADGNGATPRLSCHGAGPEILDGERITDYGCAGASEGATDSGGCDGPKLAAPPGPPGPPWKPEPGTW
jgi:hypothetical protein